MRVLERTETKGRDIIYTHIIYLRKHEHSRICTQSHTRVCVCCIFLFILIIMHTWVYVCVVFFAIIIIMHTRVCVCCIFFLLLLSCTQHNINAHSSTTTAPSPRIPTVETRARSTRRLTAAAARGAIIHSSNDVALRPRYFIAFRVS